MPKAKPISRNVMREDSETVPHPVTDPQPFSPPDVEENDTENDDNDTDPGDHFTDNDTELGQEPKEKQTRIRAVMLEAAEKSALTAFFLAAGEAWDDPVEYRNIPTEAKPWLRNFHSRGLFEFNEDLDEGRIVSVALTKKGYASLAFEPSETIRSEPRTSLSVEEREAAKAARAEKKRVDALRLRGPKSPLNHPNFRIKRMTDFNPRREGTHGWHSWELYRDGMTLVDYLSVKSERFEISEGTEFSGPTMAHFKEDLSNGYIAIYDETKEPSDPNYWVAKSLLKVREAADPSKKYVPVTKRFPDTQSLREKLIAEQNERDAIAKAESELAL